MIQVGQVLDKYELLERVGQGGMAIVYRGIDRSLKRVVAIKVLHKHLADYQEARDRFEREAQAVAKLRHENILEIFDYAAKEDSEAYIVTEFIDGQTLKQVITDRPIAFPEIGAMIILQVGRALAHAHAGGILHRDVKPENIMVRTDGVVKLMDFGISHMVDLERLTVTGQLLGSPAYMAPEHVEGRPLDFRTDVFALGIVLYQLCVGRLPFEGKNPHEVLKRIAECRFIDPRTANPRIGNRLGRIILRAMAASPSDRFPAIGEMVAALDAYLDESGIPTDKISGELGRYFAAPASYEQALEDRLIDHLTRRGKKLLAEDDRPGALDVFDRVLTIDSDNEGVIAILDGINRRLRMKAVGIGVLAALAIGGGAYMIHRKSAPPGAESPEPPGGSGVAMNHVVTRVGYDDPPPTIDAAVAEELDAQIAIFVPNPNGNGRPLLADAGAVPANEPKELSVRVDPADGSEVDFGDGRGWVPVSREDSRVARAIDRDITVKIRNPCCQSVEVHAKYGQGEVPVQLKFLPAAVIPTCTIEGVKPEDITVRVASKPARLNERSDVFFGGIPSKRVRVEFFTATTSMKSTVEVGPNQTIEVKCDPQS
ncbi:MAG: serine/threonine protein kinase [Deltaproteobacteria bacterium]|nr:serine/threonine protein kinase [Deltaproteobacteria bacterium]